MTDCGDLEIKRMNRPCTATLLDALPSPWYKTRHNHQWARCWCRLWCGIHCPAPSPRRPAACRGWLSWCIRGRGCWGPRNEPADRRRSASRFKKRSATLFLSSEREQARGKLPQPDKYWECHLGSARTEVSNLGDVVRRQVGRHFLAHLFDRAGDHDGPGGEERTLFFGGFFYVF